MLKVIGKNHITYCYYNIMASINQGFSVKSFEKILPYLNNCVTDSIEETRNDSACLGVENSFS